MIDSLNALLDLKMFERILFIVCEVRKTSKELKIMLMIIKNFFFYNE